jgi:hypothetical protein
MLHNQYLIETRTIRNQHSTRPVRYASYFVFECTRAEFPCNEKPADTCLTRAGCGSRLGVSDEKIGFISDAGTDRRTRCCHAGCPDGDGVHDLQRRPDRQRAIWALAPRHTPHCASSLSPVVVIPRWARPRGRLRPPFLIANRLPQRSGQMCVRGDIVVGVTHADDNCAAGATCISLSSQRRFDLWRVVSRLRKGALRHGRSCTSGKTP